MEEGQGAVGFGFAPTTWWREIRTGPNFLLFANFSKYILKMTPKPHLWHLPILSDPAHSSQHVWALICPFPQPTYSYSLILFFHQFILLINPVIHQSIHPSTH